LGVFRKFFEKYDISHQTVVFIEATTQMPKSRDKHSNIVDFFGEYMAICKTALDRGVDI
jgi:hypothetical protein